MIGFDVIDNWWDVKLKAMNKDKVGQEPSHYPNSFLLLLLGYANKAYFHLPYRQIEEGIAQEDTLKEKYLPFLLHYNKHRRINRLDFKINDGDNKDKDFEDEYIVIAIDSTGIKVTNRGLDG